MLGIIKYTKNYKQLSNIPIESYDSQDTDIYNDNGITQFIHGTI